MDIKKYIKDIPNFPKEGILYRDIQPLLGDSDAFDSAITQMSELLDLEDIDYFAGIESRGFIFASALAIKTGKRFKMIRKTGKLPGDNLCKEDYTLEYGTASIEMEQGFGNVVIVDDVLATGGTIAAAEKLTHNAGYRVIDSICLLDIGILKEHRVKCLISY